MDKVIKMKWMLVLMVLALIVGYFGGNAVVAKVNFADYNTLELIGNMVIDSKAKLEQNQIQVKVVSAHYTEDGLVARNDIAVLGYSKWLKKGQLLIVDIADDNLLYAKNGALLTMICKESADKIFNCEYKIPPMQLCPVPTPTPKPTPEPKSK